MKKGWLWESKERLFKLLRRSRVGRAKIPAFVEGFGPECPAETIPCPGASIQAGVKADGECGRMGVSA